MMPRWSTDEPLTALLIDDSEEQAQKIGDALRPHGIGVEWRASYGAAMEVLRDPDAGHLVDLVLIDQTFDDDTVQAEALLTADDVDLRPGMEEWHVELQQGLFIMARLDQDVREGVIPFVPAMILTHHSRLDLAARIGRLQLGGYASKQALLSDPYSTLRHSVPGIRPTTVDIDRKLGELTAAVRIEAHLVGQIRESIRRGLDPDVACSALRGLADPNDWRVVGLTLEEVDPARAAFSREDLAGALARAWFASPEGWLRVREVEPLGALDDRFQAFRLEVTGPRGTAFSALAAAAAVPAAEAPGSNALRERFGQLRAIDGCSHPVRIRAGRWTVLGCWLAEPALAGVSSVFGGIRCLLSAESTGDPQAGDAARLAALAAGQHSGRIVARAGTDPARDGAGSSRALGWRAIALGDGTRLRTRARQWSPARWRDLAAGLAAARDALAELPVERRPFGLVELRACDGTGERCAVDDPAVELIEYDTSVPGAAVPLTGPVPDAGGHAIRRRLAADVLRQLIRWERSDLAYRTMEPDGLVFVDRMVHCDLLPSVVGAEPRERARQRRGAAASLVFLLSPSPYLWPAVVERDLPLLDHGPDEGSAWEIAAVAVRALLDGGRSPAALAALLEERIDLLEAAARLDGRFPAWPPGVAEVRYP